MIEYTTHRLIFKDQNGVVRDVIEVKTVGGVRGALTKAGKFQEPIQTYLTRAMMNQWTVEFTHQIPGPRV